MTLILLAVSWIAGVYLASLVDFPWQITLLLLAASAALAFLLRVRGLTVLPAVVFALLSLGDLRGEWPSDAREPLPVPA